LKELKNSFLFSAKNKELLFMESLKPKSRSYRDLDIWKLSIDFLKEVYRVTGKFPASEIYGLTNQLRRAAVSIPSNIAEGQGRNSSKEFRQFLSIALGSVAEVETQLIIAKEINYLTEGELTPLSNSLDVMRKMLRALAASLK
jgi:four helix bundle protein